MHYYEGYVRARQQLDAIDDANRRHHVTYGNRPIQTRSVTPMVDRFGLWLGSLIAAWVIRASKRLTAERPSLSQPV